MLVSWSLWLLVGPAALPGGEAFSAQVMTGHFGQFG
jgi:hypothetical protein